MQGITPTLRKEVWKFLLGFYPWNSTTKEREEILRVKTLVFLLLLFANKHVLLAFPVPVTLLCVCRDEYFRMKVQWKSVSEEQEMRNSLLRGYRSLIGQLLSLSRNRRSVSVSCRRERQLTLTLNLSLFFCDRERCQQDRQTQYVLLWERQPRTDSASRCADDVLHVQL